MKERQFELRLYIGNKFTGIAVRPDDLYPAMWRIHGPGREPSDIVNLSRAKDAAIVWARPRGLGGGEVARWDRREIAITAGLVRLNEGAATPLAWTEACDG